MVGPSTVRALNTRALGAAGLLERCATWLQKEVNEQGIRLIVPGRSNRITIELDGRRMHSMRCGSRQLIFAATPLIHEGVV